MYWYNNEQFIKSVYESSYNTKNYQNIEEYQIPYKLVQSKDTLVVQSNHKTLYLVSYYSCLSGFPIYFIIKSATYRTSIVGRSLMRKIFSFLISCTKNYQQLFVGQHQKQYKLTVCIVLVPKSGAKVLYFIDTTKYF